MTIRTCCVCLRQFNAAGLGRGGRFFFCGAGCRKTRARVRLAQAAPPHEKTSEHPVGYAGLASAVVLQAVRDWRIARYFGDHGLMEEVEAFFRGQWFEALCDLDPAVLLDQLQREDPFLPDASERGRR